jgi:hypothetical protein
MASIRLTESRIDRGIEKFMSKVAEKADTNGTGRIYGPEVESFKGPGKALLEKMYRYAGHIDARSDIANTVVDLDAFRNGAEKLGNALKKIAKSKGDKDGLLEGTKSELGSASNTAASLARWIHANVR